MGNRHSDVSVIIPIHNTEEYLPQCLDSVFSQSWRPGEIICVDDCSTDGSSLVLEKYRQNNPDLRIIKLSEQKGAGAARNAGLAAAEGRYVAFLDSDDWWTPSYCEVLRGLIEKTGVDFVFCATTVHDQLTGRRHRRHQPRSLRNFKGRQQNRPLGRNEIEHCFHKIPVEAWGKLYRKSFLTAHNLRFRENVRYEDLFFHCDLFMAAASFALTKQHLMFHRDNRAGSITGSHKRSPDPDLTLFRAYLHDSLVRHSLLENIKSRYWTDTFGAFFKESALAPPEDQLSFRKQIADFFASYKPDERLLSEDALVRDNYSFWTQWLAGQSPVSREVGIWGGLGRKILKSYKLEYRFLGVPVFKIKSGGRKYFLGIRCR